MTRKHTINAERIAADESIVDFLERTVRVKPYRNGNGRREWYEPCILDPQVAVNLAGYPVDEAPNDVNPDDGVEYEFSVCRNDYQSPVGGWTLVARCFREGDLAIFEIAEAE
jgi:hypothetical protein